MPIIVILLVKLYIVLGLISKCFASKDDRIVICFNKKHPSKVFIPNLMLIFNSFVTLIVIYVNDGYL